MSRKIKSDKKKKKGLMMKDFVCNNQHYQSQMYLIMTPVENDYYIFLVIYTILKAKTVLFNAIYIFRVIFINFLYV